MPERLPLQDDEQEFKQVIFLSHQCNSVAFKVIMNNLSCKLRWTGEFRCMTNIFLFT